MGVFVRVCAGGGGGGGGGGGMLQMDPERINHMPICQT